jgi:hypothetical protein
MFREGGWKAEGWKEEGLKIEISDAAYFGQE